MTLYKYTILTNDPHPYRDEMFRFRKSDVEERSSILGSWDFNGNYFSLSVHLSVISPSTRLLRDPRRKDSQEVVLIESAIFKGVQNTRHNSGPRRSHIRKESRWIIFTTESFSSYLKKFVGDWVIFPYLNLWFRYKVTDRGFSQLYLILYLERQGRSSKVIEIIINVGIGMLGTGNGTSVVTQEKEKQRLSVSESLTFIDYGDHDYYFLYEETNEHPAKGFTLH